MRTGKSYPAEACYAELSVAIVIIGSKGLSFYEKMSKEDKSKVVAAILSTGMATLSVWGLPELTSALGVAGLSAVGMISGLVAIGAAVGEVWLLVLLWLLRRQEL